MMDWRDTSVQVLGVIPRLRGRGEKSLQQRPGPTSAILSSPSWVRYMPRYGERTVPHLGVTGHLGAEVDRKIVPPRSFDKRVDPEDLAAVQEVEATGDFDALLGDFWSEDEGADEFVIALRGWRHDDGPEA
jgi:hypothetical protein